MERLARLKFSICLTAIGCILGLVTTLSIQEAPSAANAIVAIRVAHLDVYWARIAFRDPDVGAAEIRLRQAWSNLGDRQYEQSVFAAHDALNLVRGIKGGPPSLYSAQWDKRDRRYGLSPES